MRAVGVIVEYNPFHNGHRYHLAQSRIAANAEVVVAVMSGHFLQRGEPALTDKWTRAKMALAGGVDIVLELPFAFACNSAPHFAHGAVQSLAALGGVEALCFGSEAGDIEPFRECADLLEQHQQQIEADTRRLLREGLSFPRARQQIVESLGLHAAELLRQPNNILGLEYLLAVRRLASNITPLTVQRIGAGYHDLEGCGDIASATGIRHMLSQEKDATPYLPAASIQLLREACNDGAVIDMKRVELSLLMALQRDQIAIAGGYQVVAGMAERLIETGRRVTDLAVLIDTLKSQHLTQTRVQRLLIYQLMDARQKIMEPLVAKGPLYLRLLAHTERGQRFLAQTRKLRQLPLIANLSRVYPLLKRFYGRDTELYCQAERMLALDLKATRVYGLLQKVPPEGVLNQDFYRSVIMPAR